MPIGETTWNRKATRGQATSQTTVERTTPEVTSGGHRRIRAIHHGSRVRSSASSGQYWSAVPATTSNGRSNVARLPRSASSGMASAGATSARAATARRIPTRAATAAPNE